MTWLHGSAPIAEQILKLKKDSGSTDSSSLALCFVHTNEAEVERILLMLWEFFLCVVLVYQVAILNLSLCTVW